MKSTLILILTTLSCHAGLVPAWLHYETDKELRRFYIDEHRLKKLRKVDLFAEEPRISSSSAARIARNHVKQMKPEVDVYGIDYISFKHQSIEGKEVSYYFVSLLTRNVANKKEDSEWVYVMLDGKVLNSVTEVAWKKHVAEQAASPNH